MASQLKLWGIPAKKMPSRKTSVLSPVGRWPFGTGRDRSIPVTCRCAALAEMNDMKDTHKQIWFAKQSFSQWMTAEAAGSCSGHGRVCSWKLLVEGLAVAQADEVQTGQAQCHHLQ